MPISRRKILKNTREGFAGPEGEPSAGCSEAQRNPQKPGPQGRAQIIQIKNSIYKGIAQIKIKDIYLTRRDAPK